MDEGVRESKNTIAVLSDNYLEAAYTLSEWAGAFRKGPRGEKRLLIPIKVSHCEIDEGLLAGIVWIDLTATSSPEESRIALLQGLEKTLEPETAPSYPGRRKPEKPAKDFDEAPYPHFMPPNWSVPFLRNPDFMGRGEELKELLRQRAQPQAICGIGGSGKTQLAVEYAYRNRHRFEIVWWVRSTERKTRRGDLAALAQQLKLATLDADQETAVAAVLSVLARRSKWLLIFDNATDRDRIRQLLPKGATGQILITSRQPNWQGVAKTVELDLFPKPDSVDYLMAALECDPEQAGQLAEELGHLPLALAQARDYIVESGLSLPAYIELFRTRLAELWDEEEDVRREIQTVRTTFEVSFQQISNGAIELLNLCAFLAAEDIPRSLLAQASQALPGWLSFDSVDPLALARTSRDLFRFSLAKKAPNQSLSVHRMVQAAVRDRLGNSRADTLRRTLALLSEAYFFEKNDLDSWPGATRLLPHALAALDHADSLEVKDKEMLSLLVQTGSCLQFVVADLQEAQALLRRAFEIAEQAFGEDAPEVGSRLFGLGWVIRDLGDYKGAKVHLERGLAIQQANYGENHPRVGSFLNLLGMVLRDLADLKQAREYLERSVEIARRDVGDKKHEVGARLFRLGMILQDLGDLDGARDHIKEALQIVSETLGEDHPEASACLAGLGLLMWELGELEAARQHLEKALQIHEQAYGPKHPKVGIRLSNLGLVLKDLGDLKGARRHFERALKITLRVYGEEHPKTAIRLANLGLVLQKLQLMDEARQHLEKALRIDRKVYGDEHPEVATDLSNMGRYFRDLGREEEARDYLKRALEINLRFFERDNPRVKAIERTLANLSE